MGRAMGRQPCCLREGVAGARPVFMSVKDLRRAQFNACNLLGQIATSLAKPGQRRPTIAASMLSAAP